MRLVLNLFFIGLAHLPPQPRCQGCLILFIHISLVFKKVFFSVFFLWFYIWTTTHPHADIFIPKMTLPHFRFSVIIISKTKTLYDARMYCKLVCGNDDDDDQHKRNYLQPYKSFWKLRKFVFLNVVHIHSMVYRKCKALQRTATPACKNIFFMCKKFYMEIWRRQTRGIFAAVSASVLLHFLLHTYI